MRLRLIKIFTSSLWHRCRESDNVQFINLHDTYVLSMSIFSFPHHEGEQFHAYFSKFQDYVEYLASYGYTFYHEDLSHVIFRGDELRV